jgi:RND superfamily putative drug exporter
MKKKKISSLAILIVWVIISVSLFKLMPDVGNLLLEKGQPHFPSNYSLKIAQKYSKEYNNYSQNSAIMNFIIVFTDDKGISSAEMNSIHNVVKKLESDGPKIGVKSVQTHFDTPALKSELVSKDNTTVLVSVNLDKEGRSLDTISSTVNKELTGTSVTHYLTGTDFVVNADVNTDMDAVHKTEMFTGIIIFIILLAVFRSPITPLVSLATILLSYLTSMGIVTQLVDKFNFPFSVATQSFLILVLFGIGTDYGLLLLTRFKEELSKNPVDIAIRNTYKNAGRTVLYSSVTVFIGFGVLWFAKFSIFKAGSAVAIGVAILIIALFTILRSFMYLLGKTMFWPVNKKLQHKDSKIWGTLTKAAVSHPFLAVIIVLAAISPVLFFQSSALNYDMLNDIGPGYESIKAIHIISDKFGEGIVSPVTIYMKNGTAMNNNDALASIDKITDNLKKVDGVASVYSVTQPQGKKIAQLYLKDQIGTVASGLSQANAGIKTVITGLAGANKKISSSLNLTDISSLINLNEIIAIKTGIPAIDKQLAVITNQISADIMKVVQSKMQGKLNSIGASVKLLENGLSQAVGGLKQISDGINQANAYLKSLPNSNNGKIFYIPADQIMKGDFKQAINNYMSKDDKITKVMILLTIDPYSKEAMNTLNNIEANLQDSLKGSSISGVTYGIDGTTSMNRDLQTLSMGDLNRTIMIMLIGIGIVLILISKSVFKSLSIIGSLLIANYTARTITALIFKDLLHRGDLSWIVPFFSSIMIFALGVDYSIFLLMRLDENRRLNTKTALTKASASVGGVIISAAIILSGTFAALYPANVPMLVELATVVIIGLILLAFILFPIFLPAMFMVIEKLEDLFNKWKSKGITEILDADEGKVDYLPQKPE